MEETPVSNDPPRDDRLVVETRRYYGEVFQTAWRTVALSSAIVVLIVFFNSDLFVFAPGGADRQYIRFAVGPDEGLAFLGVLSAVVIALVVEVDQSARLLARPDRHEMPSEELGLRTVRLRLAQWTSTALGYGAVTCGLIVVFTSEQEVFEARSAFTALAAGLVFAFTLLVNLAAENAQALLRELNRRATEMMHARIVYWLDALPAGPEPSTKWRRALADFWSDSGSTPRAAARRTMRGMEDLGIGRGQIASAGFVAGSMALAGVFFGWGALTWVAVSALIWLGVAAVGAVLITRDLFAGARALPSVEMLFLSIVGLILSVLVWLSSGSPESTGLVDVDTAGVVVGLLPALSFAAFVVTSTAWLLLTATGAYGRRWLTERVAHGLERRRRVLVDSIRR